jgi:hypothetical protein
VGLPEEEESVLQEFELYDLLQAKPEVDSYLSEAPVVVFLDYPTKQIFVGAYLRLKEDQVFSMTFLVILF